MNHKKKKVPFFSNFSLVKIHEKASAAIEALGKEKLLLPEIKKLVSDNTADINLFPDKITILPPNDNSKYASEFCSKYYSMQIKVSIKVILPISFIAFFLSFLLVFPIVSYLDKFFEPSYVSMFGSFLIAILMIYPAVLLGSSLVMPFNKGYQSIMDEQKRFENKEWMEKIIDTYENEYVLKPDERFEKLKALSSQKKLELENLIRELANTEEQRKKYKTLLEEYSSLIDQIIARYQEYGRIKDESFQELLRPKPFFRDLLVNLSSNIIWFIIGAIVSFIIGMFLNG